MIPVRVSRTDQLRGPMRPLVRGLDGEWTFAAAGHALGTLESILTT